MVALLSWLKVYAPGHRSVKLLKLDGNGSLLRQRIGTGRVPLEGARIVVGASTSVSASAVVTIGVGVAACGDVSVVTVCDNVR